VHYIWLSRQPGFKEGDHADERERVLQKADKDRVKLPPATLADFGPASWHMMPRSPEWFWETLKAEGLRFRIDRTPYMYHKVFEVSAFAKRHGFNPGVSTSVIMMVYMPAPRALPLSVTRPCIWREQRRGPLVMLL
jgi:hypothetical protein